MFGLLLIHQIRTVFRTPNWWRYVLPGASLNLLPTIVLGLLLTGALSPTVGWGLLAATFGIFLIAWGYLFRIFVDGLNGTEAFVLPEWTAWRDYASAGFWLFIIALGYCFLAVVGLSAIISVLGLMPDASSPEDLGALSLVLLFSLVFFYGFFPVVFTRFAAEGRVWAAFEPGPVWRDLRRVVRADYVQACFGLFGLSLLGNLLLGLLPYVGVVLASFFWFLVMAVFARMFGLMIRAALIPPKPPSEDLRE